MIRQATIDDLPRALVLCAEFAKTSKHIRYRPGKWLDSWADLIESGMGVMFILDDFDGALGGLAFPDLNSGEMTAMEMLWWVLPDKRGKGGELLTAYEQWAKERGCTRIIMVHLSDSMPDRLKKYYKRKGYSEMETHYVKEL